MTMNHDYTGLWIMPDGDGRKLLLPNGRFLGVRRGVATVQGEYRITGDHIEYRDDAGETGAGDFIDGVLYHGEVALYLEGVDDLAA